MYVNKKKFLNIFKKKKKIYLKIQFSLDKDKRNEMKVIVNEIISLENIIQFTKKQIEKEAKGKRNKK